MQLTPYVERLREELAVAAAAGGEEARALAERLTAPLESAVRLTLLDALAEAADEITRDLAPGSVELRLRDREPGFVVSLPVTSADDPSTEAQLPPAGSPSMPPTDGDEMARINLRLAEQLKARVEEAAARAGLSINAWLVRAVAGAIDPAARPRREKPGPQGFSGWVR